ncbi:MAG: nucleotidyl transferase AbiEii/AbiGii toxin family protein, partial [Planctomycetes bacterium]|nr:nucleotidyl transferase AbiEii/AbiGii toxin family protein [Planctomycetota bacterium]
LPWWLYRLAASGHEQQFVLKGAMLFALWQDVPGRPTRDIDLLGFGEISHDRLRQVFVDACKSDVVRFWNFSDTLLRRKGNVRTQNRSCLILDSTGSGRMCSAAPLWNGRIHI